MAKKKITIELDVSEVLDLLNLDLPPEIRQDIEEAPWRERSAGRGDTIKFKKVRFRGNPGKAINELLPSVEKREDREDLAALLVHRFNMSKDEIAEIPMIIDDVTLKLLLGNDQDTVLKCLEENLSIVERFFERSPQHFDVFDDNEELKKIILQKFPSLERAVKKGWKGS